MGVNGITGVTNTYTNTGVTNTKATEKQSETTGTTQTTDTKSTNTATETGVVFEKSNEKVTDSTKKTYTPNTALVEQLKADQQAQIDNLTSIVQKMMTGQANASAKADDIWSFLANGKFENVDEAAVAKAKEDISENGYWGVKQTSERIVDFAKALTGGDPDKIEDMRKAFEKGYKEAGKAWGKDLPDISSKTYDAVMKGFDEWAAEANGTTQKTQTTDQVIA